MSTYKSLHQQGLESDDPLEFDKQQIAQIGAYVNQNPNIQNADFAKSLTADIVVPESRYTYSGNDADAAMRNGTKVRQHVDAYGNTYYEISGVDRSGVDYTGTAGADHDRLSDQAWLAIYGPGGYREQDAALRAQLNNPNLTEAERATIQQQLNTLHVNTEALRYHSGGVGTSGYLAGPDGSQAFERELFEGNGGIAGSGSGNYGYGAYGAGGSGSGGSGSGGYGVNGYEDYIRAMYNAQQEAALASLDAAYRKNLASIARAEAGLSDAYQGARNQTAGASEIAKRNFAQYAAANGLNSGTGGQAELARNVTLQNNLNNIDTAEGQSLADLDLQRNNAAIEYNNAIAQAEAEGNYELARALYEEKVRVENAAIAAKQQQFQNDLAMMQFNAQQKQQAWENLFAKDQYDAAMDQQDWENKFKQNQYDDSLTQSGQSALADYGAAFLNAGIMPSAEMLAAMNMSEADAQRFISSMQSGDSTGTPAMSFDDAKELALGGVFTPEVLQAFYNAGWSPEAVSGMYGYNPSSGTDAPLPAPVGNNAYTGNYSRIYELLATNHPEQAGAYLDSVWSTMSPDQQKTAQDIFVKYGYQYNP